MWCDKLYGTEFKSPEGKNGISENLFILKRDNFATMREKAFQDNKLLSWLVSVYAFTLTSSLHVRSDLSDRQLLLYPVDRTA